MGTECLESASDWMKSLVGAMEETADKFLDGTKLKVIALSKELPPEFSGAFLQLIAPSDPVLIGLIGPDITCYKLSKVLLGMEPNEDLGVSDMNDAMGELINVAAGGVKSRMGERSDSIQLGLPLFLDGRLRMGGNIGVEVITAQLGGNFCALLVLAFGGKRS